MTSPMLLGVLFPLAWFVFAVPVGVYLLKSWGKSRMTGFVWLFFALVIWPAASRVLTLLINVAGFAAASHLPMGSALAFNVGLSLVETVVGGVLLLVGVVVLYRELTARLVGPGQAAPPPPRVGVDSGI